MTGARAAMAAMVAVVTVTLAATAAPGGEPPSAQSADERCTSPGCAQTLRPDWKNCPACGKRRPDARPLAERAEEWLSNFHADADFWWLAVGLGGQFLFATRFFLQWLASERRGESIVPPAFWYVSLLSGVLVLAYGIRNREPVVILSQVFNPVIYIRNIILLRRQARRAADNNAG